MYLIWLLYWTSNNSLVQLSISFARLSWSLVEHVHQHDYNNFRHSNNGYINVFDRVVSYRSEWIVQYKIVSEDLRVRLVVRSRITSLFLSLCNTWTRFSFTTRGVRLELWNINDYANCTIIILNVYWNNICIPLRYTKEILLSLLCWIVKDFLWKIFYFIFTHQLWKNILRL